MTDQVTHRQILEAIDNVAEGVDIRMGNLERNLEVHIAEGHALYVHRTEIETMFDKLVTDTAILAEVVLGTPQVDIDGQVTRSGGMKEIVEDYHSGTTKGFRTQLPPWFWTKISTAIISAAAVVAAAIIGAGG